MTLLKLFRDRKHEMNWVLLHEDERNAFVCVARRRMKAPGHAQPRS